MKLRKFLAKNKFLKGRYHKIRDMVIERKKNKEKRIRIRGKYYFINRSKNYKKLCIVLAGYKSFLWEEVFNRIKKFADEDIDICILSSGMYIEELAKICEKNDWSYLSTKRNHVGLIQNIAINLFKKAEYIYKLDEDIFVTSGFFKKLDETYKEAEKNSDFHIGMVTPLIPVNGYTYIKVLEKINMLHSYEEKFGKAYYDTTRNNKIISSIDAVIYMWNVTKNLDEINKKLINEELKYSICPIRFSIGAILFKREIFEKMGMFKVSKTIGLGEDEEDICCYCLNESKAVVVSENTIVGHLSFAPTNKEIEELYKKNEILDRISKGDSV